MGTEARREFMYRIGEFSKIGKVTIKALRYYDEVGLLKPDWVDDATGYRMYTTKQLVELHNIQSLRQIGLPIPEIMLLRSGFDRQFLLEQQRREVMAEIDYLKFKLSRINFLLSGLEVENMDYLATIKDIPSCMVYSKVMKVANYDAYFEEIPAIGKTVTDKYPDLKCATPEYCFIAYLDDEYKESDINVEFCEAVEQPKADFGEIVFKEVPAVTVVSLMHKRPYADLRNAYGYAFDWIEKNGYVISGNPRENYIDGIWNKQNEADWLTELQIPIAKR
jgi:DNA-binding transcriptional MerR regulator/effector-binding domain-containing protein